jgi:pantetheine-phosphate adenylyltransferase
MAMRTIRRKKITAATTRIWNGETAMIERVGVYPGTFDPITYGHQDIIQRASSVVDKLIIAVAKNAGKSPLFSVSERLDLAQKVIAGMTNYHGIEIEVRSFDNLLMHFVMECGATVIFRGLRAVSDFEYEFQMAGMNARLNPDIETLFLMASERCQFISSRFVKEIGRLGGDISSFVSPLVREKLNERWAENRASGDD